MHRSSAPRVPFPVAAACVGALACGAASRDDEGRPFPRFESAPGSPFAAAPRAGRPSLGDLDRDGHVDLVVPCDGEPDDQGAVVVLLGDGRGGFARYGEALPVGPTVHRVALGDIDEDGDLDVAAIEHDRYEATLFLGDGRGGFAAADPPVVVLRAGDTPHTHDVLLADVDADGHLDLLATNADHGDVSVLRGDGHGRFGPPTSVPAGEHPYTGLSLADLDGDRRPDVVAPDMHGNAVAVAKNLGGGSFAAAEITTVGFRPGFLVTGDVDGDGRPDVVVTHDDDPLVDVLLATERGGLVPAPGSPLEPPETVWGGSIGDLDGDRRADLALANGGAEGIFLYRGLGEGRFELSGAPLRASEEAGYVEIADVDEDGLLDLVIPDGERGAIAVLLQRR
jgi:hypothetical protein